MSEIIVENSIRNILFSTDEYGFWNISINHKPIVYKHIIDNTHAKIETKRWEFLDSAVSFAVEMGYLPNDFNAESLKENIRVVVGESDE